MSDATILIAEDDWDLRDALADTLELAGFDVVAVSSGEQALQELGAQHIDLLVSDVNMDEMDGHQLLRRVRAGFPLVPVLLITAYGSISQSVDAMRSGASDYLVKPFKPQQLVDTVKRYLPRAAADEDFRPVAEEASSRQLLGLARKVARSDATVLITGESGTGKEVLARYLHQHSPRVDRVFVAINCAAIPENMLEATLFGHEKGAFTGAHSASPGKFEQADGGTILLDEISEMDVNLQAKILRVLQEREVERLGGRRTIDLDVRVIATTNRDLKQAVADGHFREDLYYRLSVFPLHWRPLRERPADIVPLARGLLEKHAGKMGCAPASFDEQACQWLREYDWPGNVRELENVIQRALIVQEGGVITADSLDMEPTTTPAAVVTVDTDNAGGGPESGDRALQQALSESASALGSDLKRREFEIILRTLREQGGRRRETAEVLGVSARTLRYKLARMRDSGINVESVLRA